MHLVAAALQSEWHGQGVTGAALAGGLVPLWQQLVAEAGLCFYADVSPRYFILKFNFQPLWSYDSPPPRAKAYSL